MIIRPTFQTQITICIHFLEKILRLKDSLSVFPKSGSSMYKCRYARMHWGLFSGQTFESGSSELNFHVVSGPGELVYRAQNQSRSFNYPLSVESECVASSLNGKWDEARRHWGQRACPTAVILSCIDMKLSSLVAVVYLIALMQMWNVHDLGNKTNHIRDSLWCLLLCFALISIILVSLKAISIKHVIDQLWDLFLD